MSTAMTGQPRETSGRATADSQLAGIDRAALEGVAYRMLGSTSEAEDAVQEAYARWLAQPAADRAAVRKPTGWLVRTVSRICLDVLRSARVRRERYVGDWLPEPVPDHARWTSQAVSAGPPDPSEQVALDESLSMALLVVLETMTPAQRVAFVLHDVFGYTFTEIGDVVGRSPQASRQLASSARRRVGAARAPLTAGADHDAAVAAFKAAWESGDLDALLATLDPDAVVVTDGGGLVPALREAVRGADAVARVLLAIRTREPTLALHPVSVNGEAGLLATGGGRVQTVIAIGAAGSRVSRVWAVRNPHKLDGWAMPDT